jgi:hypothetical protein
MQGQLCTLKKFSQIGIFQVNFQVGNLSQWQLKLLAKSEENLANEVKSLVLAKMTNGRADAALKRSLQFIPWFLKLVV